MNSNGGTYALDGGLVEYHPCDAFGPSIPGPAWVRSSRDPKLPIDSPALRHAASQFYDSCELKEYVPDLCPNMVAGASFCAPSFQKGGRLSSLCRSDSDCPSRTRCRRVEGMELVKFGHCEATCSNEADCLRADLTCDKSRGLCREIPKAPLLDVDGGESPSP